MATSSLQSAAMLVGLGLAWGDAPSHWAEGKEELDFDAGGVAALDVQTQNGDVLVQAGAGERVRVTVRKKAGGRDEADAKACLDAIQISTERVKDELRIGWKWRVPQRGNWSATVAFDVTTPPGRRVAIEAQNGSARVMGEHGACRVRIQNGPIEIDGAAGPLNIEAKNGKIKVKSPAREIALDTRNGAVEVELTGAGPVSGTIESTNGPMKVQLHAGVSTVVDGTTTNGELVIKPVTARLSGLTQSAGHLTAKAGAGEGKLYLKTQNGKLELH